jgi:flagellar protein FliO/FliZ
MTRFGTCSRHALRIVAGVCLFAPLFGAFAETASGVPAKLYGAPTATPAIAAGGVGGAAQVTLALLVVLAAVFAAGWLLRRVRGVSSQGAIKVVADLPLGAKERAVLIQLGGQQLLLGVAPGQVRTLHVLAEPVVESTSITTSDAGAQHPVAPDFKSLLRRSLGLS